MYQYIKAKKYVHVRLTIFTMYSMHESWHENANIVCMKIYQLPVSKPDDVIWKYSHRYNTVKKKKFEYSIHEVVIFISRMNVLLHIWLCGHNKVFVYCQLTVLPRFVTQAIFVIVITHSWLKIHLPTQRRLKLNYIMFLVLALCTRVIW